MNEVTSGGSYRSRPGWEARLIEEEAELAERLGKLREFLKGEEFKVLKDSQQGLLVEQEGAMEKYLGILRERVKGLSAPLTSSGPAAL